jgi:hypothetical protein
VETGAATPIFAVPDLNQIRTTVMMELCAFSVYLLKYSLLVRVPGHGGGSEFKLASRH